MQKFLVGVIGIILNNENKVLAMKAAREWKEGLWEFPGGKLEVGENPQEGILREIKEEVGLEVALEPRPVKLEQSEHGGEPVLLIYFLARSEEQEVTLSSEHSTYRWLSLEEFLDLKTWPNDKKILADIVSMVTSE